MVLIALLTVMWILSVITLWRTLVGQKCYTEYKYNKYMVLKKNLTMLMVLAIGILVLYCIVSIFKVRFGIGLATTLIGKDLVESNTGAKVAHGVLSTLLFGSGVIYYILTILIGSASIVVDKILGKIYLDIQTGCKVGSIRKVFVAIVCLVGFIPIFIIYI